MLCPSCKSELIVTGQKRLETLDEHVSCSEVSLKNKYDCSNSQCPTHNVVFWNENGELYVGKGNWNKAESIQFINNNNAPFGSYERKANVEIYKENENYDLLNIGRYKFRIKFCYKSNENGDILKRSRKLEIWLKDPRGGYALYISGIHMLIFSLKGFHRNLKKAKTSQFFKDEINKKLQIEEWQKKDWWRRAAHWYMNKYVKLFGF